MSQILPIENAFCHLYTKTYCYSCAVSVSCQLTVRREKSLTYLLTILKETLFRVDVDTWAR